MNVGHMYDGNLIDLVPQTITAVAGSNTIDFSNVCAEFEVHNYSAATIYVAWDGQEVINSTGARINARASATTADIQIPVGGSYTHRCWFRKLFINCAAGVKINDFTTPTAGIHVMAGRKAAKR